MLSYLKEEASVWHKVFLNKTSLLRSPNNWHINAEFSGQGRTASQNEFIVYALGFERFEKTMYFFNL